MGAARPLPLSADIGPGGQSVGQAAQFCLDLFPDRPEWIHKIKHDGYRMMVRRDGSRVRFTLNSHDWADRFLALVEAAARFKALSFLIDGEVVIARDDGMLDFHPLRSQRRGAVRLRPD